MTRSLGQGGPAAGEPELGSSGSGQQLLKSCLGLPGPLLPLGNLDGVLAAVDLIRHQRIATLLGSQRPMRAPLVVEGSNKPADRLACR